jgi:hypothetical protein
LRFQSVRHSRATGYPLVICTVSAKKKKKKQNILFFEAAQKSYHYTEGHVFELAFSHEHTSHAAFN